MTEEQIKAHLKEVKDVVKAAIKSGRNKYGHVGYWGADKAVAGAYTVIKWAEKHITKGETELGVRLLVLAHQEILKEQIDDSSAGQTGTLTDDIVESLKNATKLSHPKDDKKLFDVIFKHAFHKVFDGWDEWRYAILGALMPLCSDATNRKKLEEVIFSPYMQEEDEDDFDKKYDTKRKQVLHLALIISHDSEEAIESFIKTHLDNDDIRKMAVERALTRKQYNKAIELIAPIKKDDWRRREWDSLLLQAYEGLGDRENIRRTTAEFIKLGDIKESYSKYKALFNESEWPLALNELLKQCHDSVAIKIAVKENLADKLLTLCKKGPFKLQKRHTIKY
jgi:hypothetical protein